MKNTVILLISIATFTACTKQNTKQVSTIDSTLQVRVDSILQNKLSELDATVGQVIVASSSDRREKLRLLLVLIPFFKNRD